MTPWWLPPLYGLGAAVLNVSFAMTMLWLYDRWEGRKRRRKAR
jgi:hypothetical protein